MQIVKRGAQDLYLVGNPQMTYFKSVYRNYTNFGIDHLHIEAEGNNNISLDKDTIIDFKIPRHGDLLNRIYYVFVNNFCSNNLPNKNYKKKFKFKYFLFKETKDVFDYQES